MENERSQEQEEVKSVERERDNTKRNWRKDFDPKNYVGFAHNITSIPSTSKEEERCWEFQVVSIDVHVSTYQPSSYSSIIGNVRLYQVHKVVGHYEMDLLFILYWGFSKLWWNNDKWDYQEECWSEIIHHSLHYRNALML